MLQVIPLANELVLGSPRKSPLDDLVDSGNPKVPVSTTVIRVQPGAPRVISILQLNALNELCREVLRNHRSLHKLLVPR